MVALKMRPGVRFDPKAFFDFCDRQVTEGGMDRKWFPILSAWSTSSSTQTEKILVRNLKRVHFDRRRLGNEPVLRVRGDTAYRPLAADDYEKLRAEFAAREKIDLLDR
jgi:hypothetical protein